MSPTSNATRVLVFTKAPRPGFAKTRLIPVLGEQGAAALQARLIKHTLKSAKRAALGPVELHGTPADDDFLRYCAECFEAELVPQRDGDLGARMAAAFTRALARSPRAVLVGSDCPALTPARLRRATRALQDGYDAVFVPTEDGGYALVGLRRCDPKLFEDISWSTSSVMQATRDRLAALGWHWMELDTVWDVDDVPGYDRLLASGLLDRATIR